MKSNEEGFKGVILSLQNEFGTYTIKTDEPHEGIEDLRDFLLCPLLLAIGYHPDSVASIFGEE